jgi:DNA-binding NarL/FixJ family response regulator
VNERRPALGVVDDQPPILWGVLAALAELLEPHSAVTASRVTDLLDVATDLDLVLLDLQLGDDSDPAVNVSKLVERGWPVLLYTQETRGAVVSRCLRAGAGGLVAKNDDLAVLVEAVREMLAGGAYLTPEWAAALEDDESRGVPELAPREAQAWRLYATGLPLKSVARRMGISAETAKEYLVRVKRKYADANRPAPTKTDLYRRAVEDGHLAEPEPRPPA